MKYQVIEDCCWGPKGRRWEAGTVVELDDNVKPPRFFKKIEGEIKPVEPVKEVKTYSEIGTGAKPLNAGFAYDKNKDNHKNKGAGK